jgi:hypothetical protein
MRISKERSGNDARCSRVDESIDGRRLVSLYAGMITLRSKEAASWMDGSWRGFWGSLGER